MRCAKAFSAIYDLAFVNEGGLAEHLSRLLRTAQAQILVAPTVSRPR